MPTCAHVCPRATSGERATGERNKGTHCHSSGGYDRAGHSCDVADAIVLFDEKPFHISRGRGGEGEGVWHGGAEGTLLNAVIVKLIILSPGGETTRASRQGAGTTTYLKLSVRKHSEQKKKMGNMFSIYLSYLTHVREVRNK